MTDGSFEVYLPVVVQFEDGEFRGGYVDFDGAPWMFVADEDNVWDGEEWMRYEPLEEDAIVWLNDKLRSGD